VGEPGTRKYVGSAFVSVNREMRERLCKRVQEHAGEAPKDMKKRPATQWVKPGMKACVKHLRGEDDLRHASLPRLWEDQVRRDCFRSLKIEYGL
jgi:bifunctional non-homologous end joining protein LigD